MGDREAYEYDEKDDRETADKDRPQLSPLSEDDDDDDDMAASDGEK